MLKKQVKLVSRGRNTQTIFAKQLAEKVILIFFTFLTLHFEFNIIDIAITKNHFAISKIS